MEQGCSKGGPAPDYMPCGLPAPTLWQTLGLPTLSCPRWMGPLCGGISPIMDADAANNPCVADALKAGATNVGIDLLGFLPEAGGVARVVGHQAGYVGKVA